MTGLLSGTMMGIPLSVPALIERAGTVFAHHMITSRSADGVSTYRYADLLDRVRRMAHALVQLGVQPGDRVASYAWNTREHLELYFAVPAIGAVLHTINIRLSPQDVAFIIDDAGDTVLIHDQPLPDEVYEAARSIRNFVHIGSDHPRLDDELAYEELMSTGDPDFVLPRFDENSAAVLCYTSGTTGTPKGVAYSHRSICLYALMANQPDAFGIRESDVVLPVVPMFHANAWGLPYIATMAGAAMVLPGPAPTPAILTDLIRDQQVSIAAAVPTIYQGLLEHATGPDLSSVRELICGGAAVPEALIRAFDTRFGVPLVQGWGMTETSPLAAISRTDDRDELDADARYLRRARQGRVLPFLAARLDAAAGGELQLHGPTVTAAYLHGVSPGSFTDDGWLRTGDIAEIDEQHYIKLVDRTKDLVKSGGEWISSVELESAALFHPGVTDAAVVARPDPKWGERPHMFVVCAGAADVHADDVRTLLAEKFPRWWLPDVIEFVAELPRTTVGKIDKKRLRATLAEDMHAGSAQVEDDSL